MLLVGGREYSEHGHKTDRELLQRSPLNTIRSKRGLDVANNGDIDFTQHR